ncbi:Multidrug efflux pump subunit AcrA precursor [compost metagenome]
MPQRGIQHTPEGGATALVVDAAGKVELRPVKAGRAIGAEWLVTDGLAAGDRVVVDGLQKAKPGATVKVVPAAAAVDVAAH